MSWKVAQAWSDIRIKIYNFCKRSVTKKKMLKYSSIPLNYWVAPKENCGFLKESKLIFPKFRMNFNQLYYLGKKWGEFVCKINNLYLFL